jgi:hypothetical protein
MVRRSWWPLVGALALILSACGGDSGEEERGDLETYDPSAGKADLPGWYREIKADWGCGETASGAFKGYDSAHAYRFELKQGYRYRFELRASYPASKGAALALYVLPSGKRVAFDRRPWENEATLSFVPPKDGSYAVGLYSIALSATGDYGLRAVCQPAILGELEKGQHDFTSYELRQSFWRLGQPGGPEIMTAKNAGTAPGGRSGEVEEADIYKIEKDRLYLLNTYRGFMVLDIADRKQPKVLARLPIYGTPVEMFVQKSTVYALVRDALYLTQDKGQLHFQRHGLSQLHAIEISNPSKPKLLSTVEIAGELREGLSRKIDDTIYVVSYTPQGYGGGWRYQQDPAQKEQAWVYSFSVASPGLKLVDKLQIFEGGSGSESDEQAGTSKTRSFNSIAISATENALMVVENWNTWGSVSGSSYSCGSYESLQQAVVSLVDISSPSGKIKLHTKFETYGELRDQFKQTYLHDATTGKGTYLGIFARREWLSKDCKGESRIENNLEAWDVTVGAAPKKLSSLSFGKPNETIRGSAFDPERKVAFAITAEQIDPLYALSFANPSKLAILSEIGGLSGDMTVFRLIGDRKFLLGIGRDTSAACTGFDSPAAGFASNIAASIIDVQDLGKIRLVQRKCVTVQDASFVGSELTWNLDQAHKLIGMHEDGLKNLVTIPVHYSKKTSEADGWWWRHETAVGILSWDLARYDPAKDEKTQTVLESHGTVVHPQGEVRRSIVYTHPGVKPERTMLNVSNTHLALTSLEDLAKPVALGSLEVAPFRRALLQIGGALVEQVEPGWESGADGKTTFRVKKLGAGVDTAPALASFEVKNVLRVLKHGTRLVVLRQAENAGVWTVEAVIYELKNPLQPVLLGALPLPVPYLPYWTVRPDRTGVFGEGDRQVVLSTRGVAFLKSEWDDKAQANSSSLVLLDLAGSKPSLTEQKLPAVKGRSYLELVPDGAYGFFLGARDLLGEETVEGRTFEKVKHHAQRWSWYSWGAKAVSSVNLPGRLMESFSLGTPLMLTSGLSYELGKNGEWAESSWLALLLPGFTSATLVSSTTLTGLTVASAAREGSRLYLDASARRIYGGGPGPALKVMMPTAPAEDELVAFDLYFLDFQRLFQHKLGTENATILAATKGRLLYQLPGDGLLVIDASNPSKPRGQQFLRTQDWGTEAEVVGTTAYVAAGYYGIYELDLASSGALPTSN